MNDFKNNPTASPADNFTSAGAGPAIQLRTGIIIYPQHEVAIDRLLGELVDRCPATVALLADSSGQLISFKGERGSRDLIALSSLVAGDLAASQEIARLTGEYHACQLIIREGQNTNTFIAESGEHLVLFVQVSRDVPLGWARMLIQFTGRQLSTILATRPAILPELNFGLSDENLADEVGDALDSLWTN